MNYHQFRRFMWFPLLRRFLWAWSAFCYAWKNVHPTKHWTGGFSPWVQANLSFKVGDFDYIKGGEGFKNAPLPNGLEPFMLKKRCIGPNGEVRFFDVIPQGWRHFDIRESS